MELCLHTLIITPHSQERPCLARVQGVVSMYIDVRAHTWKVDVGCRLSKLVPPPRGYSRTTLFSLSCGVSPVVQSTNGQPGHNKSVLFGAQPAK